MPRLVHQSPKYRKHVSGQAVVTLDGRDIYLGPHGTKTSKAEYDRVIGEWMANGRRLPATSQTNISVAELIDRFWLYAKAFYVLPVLNPDGSQATNDDGTPKVEPSGEQENYRHALKPVLRLYSGTLVADFGPLSLESVMAEMVRLGWCRNVVNRQIGRVKCVFKWGVSKELVPVETHQRLLTVAGLRKGKSQARESKPVKSVSHAYVDAVLSHVSSQVAAMIKLQLLTGMRPGEVCMMRARDIEMSGKSWVYRPMHHKTQHHDITREIYLGPKAQEILNGWLKNDLQAYLFSPAEAEQKRHQSRAESRKTPKGYGNGVGTNRKRKPTRCPGNRYDSRAYAHAIAKGCDRAFPLPADLARQKVVAKNRTKLLRWETDAEWMARLGDDKFKEAKRLIRDRRWHPNQLRHTAATTFRREYSLDVSRVLLGHTTSDTTEIYAEQDMSRARAVMEAIG